MEWTKSEHTGGIFPMAVIILIAFCMIYWLAPYVMMVGLLVGLGFCPMMEILRILLIIYTAVVMWRWGRRMARRCNHYDKKVAKRKERGNEMVYYDEPIEPLPIAPIGDELIGNLKILLCAYFVVVGAWKLLTLWPLHWQFNWYLQMVVLAVTLGTVITAFSSRRLRKPGSVKPMAAEVFDPSPYADDYSAA